MSEKDIDEFDAKCIDVAAGEKAQIRIPNPYTKFNVTNYMKFENIEFTGEDLFASVTFMEEEMGFMGQHGLLAYMPFEKCHI